MKKNLIAHLTTSSAFVIGLLAYSSCKKAALPLEATPPPYFS